MARQKSMATIQAALANKAAGSMPTKAPETSPQPLVPGSPGSPVSNAITGVTADQKRAYDIQRQEGLDQRKDLLTQEAEFRKQADAEEAQKTALERNTQQTIESAKKIARGTSIRIASLPTPGGIVLPLVVLLVFFLLLVPVNGHTRATWLWLVISGNADLGLPTGTSSSSGSPLPGDVLGTPGGAASTPTTVSTPSFTLAPTFTGVEGAVSF